MGIMLVFYPSACGNIWGKANSQRVFKELLSMWLIIKWNGAIASSWNNFQREVVP
jgi:hypothetical protein